ncbi:MAG: thiamine pyrophosphate-dependent enzyme, partial [Deltaproteobacteria bacterium]
MGVWLPNKDNLLRQYRTMMMIRRFEEESARNYAKGKIGGFLHLYIGQEAIAVAAAEVLEDRDYIFQTYRDHGIALARGMSAKSAMAELFGKDTG